MDQRLLNSTNVLWKNLTLYQQLNLILNYYEGLALFIDKSESLRVLAIKNLQKKNNEDFFLQLHNA